MPHTFVSAAADAGATVSNNSRRVRGTWHRHLCLMIVMALMSLSWGACTRKLTVEEQQTREHLKAELTSIQQAIEEAHEEHNAYSGGLIKTLIALRLELLKTNEALVTQRIHALEAGSKITVVIHATKDDPDRALQLLTDLEAQKATLAEARHEANRYAGGLVKAMTETSVATASNTVAILQQQYLIAKYGLSLPKMPTPAPEDMPPAKAPVPGSAKPDPGRPTIKQCLTIDTFDSSELSRNTTFVELAWKVDVKNTCDQPFVTNVRFILYDKDEFELDSDRASIQVPAHGVGKARGKMLVNPPEKALRMTTHGVKLSAP